MVTYAVLTHFSRPLDACHFTRRCASRGQSIGDSGGITSLPLTEVPIWVAPRTRLIR